MSASYSELARDLDMAEDRVNSIARTIANRLVEGTPDEAWVRTATKMYTDAQLQLAACRQAIYDRARAV